MKYIALFFSLWFLFACSPAKPENPELPCPENWMFYEEGQKEDAQFQRIEKMAKEVAGAQNIEGYEEFFFLDWKYCELCCQFGCDQNYKFKAFQFIASRRDTSYFLKTIVRISEFCNHIEWSTSEQLEEEEWDAIKNCFEKYQIGCKREQQKPNRETDWRLDGVDVLVKNKDKGYYEYFLAMHDSTGRKFISSLIDKSSNWPTEKLGITKTRDEENNYIGIGLGIYPLIFTERVAATKIRSPFAYREENSTRSTYIHYTLDTNEIADSTLNTRYFEGELMIKPLGNEDKKSTAKFKIDLHRGFSEPPQQ